MAIIYGRADSEKQLLNKYPKKVRKIEDISRVHQEMKEEVEKHETKGLVNKIKIWNKKGKSTNLKKIKMIHFIPAQKGNYER